MTSRMSRLVLIKGAGRAFCTGIDLKQLTAGKTPHQYYESWDRALRILEQSEKILICAMHGYALGGGLQLALACDIRIATEDCQFGLPAIKEGIVPGLGTLRLPRYIGLGRAKWMALSGENIDGRRAYEIGLIDHLVNRIRLMTKLMLWSRSIHGSARRERGSPRCYSICPSICPTASFLTSTSVGNELLWLRRTIRKRWRLIARNASPFFQLESTAT